MVRPAAKELTQRELEVMHVFWTSRTGGTGGQSTVAEVRGQLAAAGRDLAYTTVATLVRILTEKGFLEQTNAERPFQYRPVRSFEEVSRSILGDLVERVFHGSREQLLVRLLAERRLDRQGTGRAGGHPPGEKTMNTIGIALGVVRRASHADRSVGRRPVSCGPAASSGRRGVGGAHRPGDCRGPVAFGAEPLAAMDDPQLPSPFGRGAGGEGCGARRLRWATCRRGAGNDGRQSR